MPPRRRHRSLAIALAVGLACSGATGALAQNTAAGSAGATTGAAEPARLVLRPTIPAYYAGCGHEADGSDEKANCSAGKLMGFIARTLVYPDEAREERVEGVVVLSFIVSDSGAVEDVRILRDIGAGCGAEAERVVRAMPRWQPAMFKGERVRTQFTLPITFGLKTGMFDYVLHLGAEGGDGLPDGEVYRGEIVDAVSGTAPRVTDPKGKELVVTEMVYTFERGGERRELVTRGKERPGEKAFAKWLGRKPGRLTVEANVVEGLDIRTVSKQYVVVR